MWLSISFPGEDDGQIIRELIPYDSTGTRARRNTLTGMFQARYILDVYFKMNFYNLFKIVSHNARTFLYLTSRIYAFAE